MKRLLLLALALSLVSTAGCAAGPAPSVRVTEAWPDKPLGYEEAYRRWTRRETRSSELILDIDAEATLQTPEWRAAYVAETARRRQLPPDDAAKLAAAEQADAKEVWQVELVVSTHSLSWNDFGKKEKSMWRVALVGDDGREALPVSVKEDKRQVETVKIFYPDMALFQRAYIVRFPKVAADGKPLVGEGSKRVSLKITSAVSGVELVWSGN